MSGSAANEPRSSSVRARREAAEAIMPLPTPPATETTPLPLPFPDRHVSSEGDDSPTVIRTKRGRGGPDPQLAEALAGRKLAHFELIESVGMGGMAAVIKATDTELNRVVALKILPPDLAVDPENITRFKQEARSAARLDHENVARVYFCGEDQGLHFIAFEFVEGQNLRVRLEEHLERTGKPLTVADCVNAMLQVAAGLAHAASRGVVHRDIKPSNVIITPEGKIKIVDMGLARNLDGQLADGGVTQSGVTLGTFDYISPEQAIDPRQADCRSDIYSLGCTFYHLLTGYPPVPDGTPAKKLHYHQDIPPIDPRQLNPLVPDEFAVILGRMMAKKVADRYQHPDHLIAHLIELARHLKLGMEPAFETQLQHARPYADQLVPEPPRLSAGWVAAAVVGLVVGTAILTDNWGTGTAPPLEPVLAWETPAPRQGNDVRVTPPPDAPAANGAGESQALRVVATVPELLDALRNPAVVEIHLNAPVFDLTVPPPGAQELPRAVIRGRERLTLKGIGSQPQLIRVRPASIAEGSPRWGALSVVADAGPLKLTMHNLHWQLAGPELNPEAIPARLAAWSWRGSGSLHLDHCLLSSPDRGENDDGPSHAYFAPRSNAQLTVQSSVVRPGSVPFRTHGRLDARLGDTLVAPVKALFKVERPPPDAADAAPFDPAPKLSLRLEEVSALMQVGSLVEVGDGAKAQIKLGHCLFSAAAAESILDSRAVVVRALGDGFAGISLANLAADTPAADAPYPNAYHNVHLCATTSPGGMYYPVALANGKNFDIRDAGGREVPYPWLAPPYIAFDPDNPFDKKPFYVDLNLPELRVNRGGNRDPLGARHFLNELLYSRSIPAPREPTPSVENQWVFDPQLKDDERTARAFGDWKSALAAVKPGGELLLRFNGLVEVPPYDFNAADLPPRLTIKPYPGMAPVLAFSSSPKTALFRLFQGELTFEKLQFRLRPTNSSAVVPALGGGANGGAPAESPGRGNEYRSVVSLPGGGTVKFRDCGITLSEPESGRFAVVTLLDSAGEMMPTGDRVAVPKIVFENSVVRGRGRWLDVQSSRTFELDIKNGLAVLDGSLIEMAEPTRRDLATLPAAQIRLNQVTTYLTEHLLHGQAVKNPETRALNLLKIELTATNCLFVPGIQPARGLVRFDKVESRMQIEEQRLFVWKDPRNNVYAYDREQTFLELEPEDREMMPTIKKFDGDEWLKFAQEAGAPFGEVRFQIQPETRRSFANIQAGDFRLSTPNPALKRDSGTPFGCAVDQLPQYLRGE